MQVQERSNTLSITIPMQVMQIISVMSMIHDHGHHQGHDHGYEQGHEHSHEHRSVQATCIFPI